MQFDETFVDSFDVRGWLSSLYPYPPETDPWAPLRERHFYIRSGGGTVVLISVSNDQFVIDRKNWLDLTAEYYLGALEFRTLRWIHEAVLHKTVFNPASVTTCVFHASEQRRHSVQALVDSEQRSVAAKTAKLAADFAADRAGAKVRAAADSLFEKRPDYCVTLKAMRQAAFSIDRFGDAFESGWTDALAEFVNTKVLPVTSLTAEEIAALPRRLTEIILHLEQTLEQRWDGTPEPVSHTHDKTGAEFETYCLEIVSAAGYAASRVARTGDQGADLLVKSQGGHIVIQCKCHAKPIGNRAVQEAAAARGFYDAAGALVVSASSPFTLSARQLAKKLEVGLAQRDTLLDTLRLFSICGPE